ncbi:MAG TPA: DNA polymerase III subunit gamma/tau [Candidatus Melainabacteria bacterium]|nr:DNA polymerase III subunit gamma/tau [Candidatus Melainabacteria bacterium]
MENAANNYLPLYLKYRPQSLEELVGQKSVVKTLSNALENNRIAHAYLFTGPRGTGKTSSARILAKSINCDQGPTVSPCLKCASCESIKNSSSTSVFEIDAASNNSVDDARSLIERAPLATQDGKHKLYIIDECHMLTKEAFNALLKTIEEPPPNVVFILATTEEHKVPPTIVSRCQRLMFRLVNQVQLAEHLNSVAAKEGIEISEEALDLMSRRSGGGLRDALGLLDQASLLSKPGEPVQVTDLLVLLGALDEDNLLEISLGVKDCNGEAVLQAVNKLLLQGREPSLITVELAKHFLALTKASYLKTGEPISEENVQFVTGSRAYVEKVTAQAREFERTELSQIVELMDRLEQNIKRSSQPSLTLEMGLLSICHRIDIASVKNLTEKVKKLEKIIADGDFSAADIPQTRVRSTPAPAAPAPAPAPAPVSTAAPEPIAEAPSREPVLEPERPESRTPQPVHEVEEEDDAADIEAAASGGGFVSNELEALWSDLLDAIHKISIPAYSLVHMHANPLSLENGQLTLGVNKEFFQKSIEGKSDQIEKAYRAVTGQEVTVKVKVVQEEELVRKKPEGRPASPAMNDQRKPEPKEREKADSVHEHQHQPVTEPSQRPPRLSPEHQEPVRSRIENEDKTSSESESESETGNGNGNGKASSEDKPSSPREEPEEQSTLLKEAYRLFEGPGSRQIG